MHNYDEYPKMKRAHLISRLFLLTHLGSNQYSAEPKSDVLPITPWVNVLQNELQN
jgi:hypothetical protein